MKSALIVLCGLVFTSLSEAKWCIKNITTEIEVTKILTRTTIVPSWYKDFVKTESYLEVERIPKTKEKRVCCDGYILDEFGKQCFPECPNGCPDTAKCVEPNTCECPTGYNLKENSCQKICTNCENGLCLGSGDCQCNPMYVRIEDACKPICLRKCTNGYCAAPNICECNPGFRENSETNRCEPICKETCGTNAYCSAPELCTCRYGFFGNASDICQPWCKSECKNGECVGPNNCACHQGFVSVEGLCLPDCHSGCAFGDCIDEKVCRCWPTYLYNNATGSCQERLDEIHPTTADSLDDKRWVTPPSHQNHPTTSDTPDDKQWQTSPFHQLHWEHLGNENCVDGHCFCVEGFTKVDLGCFFHCKNCKIGQCVKTEECENSSQINVAPSSEPNLFSNTQETTSEASSTVDLSTTTTEQTATPICVGNCWAGSWVDGVFICPDGLILNDKNDCIMPCEAKCKNGICTQDNICECSSGYVHMNDTECVPQCDKECINGFCVAPNHCECLEGYIPHMHPSFRHLCLPTCNGIDGKEGCLNGTCVAVNKCQCLEGFVPKLGNRFECIPYVEGAKKMSNSFWYVYLILGILILLLMTALGLYLLRKMYRDSYNVDKYERKRGTVAYQNGEQPYCVI